MTSNFETATFTHTNFKFFLHPVIHSPPHQDRCNFIIPNHISLIYLAYPPPHPHPPDHCGKLQNTARVLLVATHADKPSSPCTKNGTHQTISPDANHILDKVLTMFQYDLEICPRVFVVDTQVHSSSDMRALRQEVTRVRSQISHVSSKIHLIEKNKTNYNSNN